MAYSFDGASVLSLNISESVSGYPLLVSAWCRATATPVAGQVPTNVCDIAGTSGRGITISSSGGGVLYRAQDGTAFASSTTVIPLNEWAHVLVGLFSAEDRRVWINGEQEGTNVTAIVPGTFNRLAIGAFDGLIVFNQFTGDVAEVIYAREEASDELARYLAAGFGPWGFIRPTEYVPLWTLNDTVARPGGGVLTPGAGTPTWISDHPRIQREGLSTYDLGYTNRLPAYQYDYRRRRA